MIKSLEIQNFQSHEKSNLEFDPGVNIIIGPSDSGKTAIIRALRWLKDNRPSGSSMRSNWGGKTSVEIFTDDTHIVRSKDKEEEYILGDTHFKAFKTDVPEEIQQALNMSDINLQRQLDQPFLLSETPGAVALHFNKVARLDKIDTGLQNVNSWIRELTADLKYKGEQKETFEEDLKQFEHLEKFEVDVEVLEDLDKKHLSVILSTNSFDKLIRNITHLDILIGNQKEVLQIEKPVDDLLTLFGKKYEIFKQQGGLLAMIDDIVDVNAEINQYNKLIELEKPINDLLQLYKEKSKAEEERKLLFKVVSNINNTTTQLDDTKARHTALLEKFNREMGSVCLLCGSKLK